MGRRRLKYENKTQSPHPVGSSAWLAGVELLARRAYPDLKHSGFCSRHRDDGHFECGICYPDLNGLLDAHMEVSNKLYDQILELSGLSDPANGRVGTNAIVAELRRKLKPAND